MAHKSKNLSTLISLLNPTFRNFKVIQSREDEQKVKENMQPKVIKDRDQNLTK